MDSSIQCVIVTSVRAVDLGVSLKLLGGWPCQILMDVSYKGDGAHTISLANYHISSYQ